MSYARKNTHEYAITRMDTTIRDGRFSLCPQIKDINSRQFAFFADSLCSLHSNQLRNILNASREKLYSASAWGQSSFGKNRGQGVSAPIVKVSSSSPYYTSRTRKPHRNGIPGATVVCFARHLPVKGRNGGLKWRCEERLTDKDKLEFGLSAYMRNDSFHYPHIGKLLLIRVELLHFNGIRADGLR